MPIETMKFQNGAEVYRIQFEIVAPPPGPVIRPGTFNKSGIKPQFTVASIRVIEITENVAEEALKKKIINFGRSFDTLAQARTGAGEYAKRIVRERMTEKAAPPPAPEAT